MRCSLEYSQKGCMHCFAMSNESYKCLGNSRCKHKLRVRAVEQGAAGMAHAKLT